MNWTKQGVLFSPDNYSEWMAAYAAVPTAEPVAGSLYRVYFAARNNQGRSLPGYILVDWDSPKKILEVSPDPLLTLGDPGTFDEDGIMPCWVIRDHGITYMYYIGWNRGVSVPFRNAVGLAVSEDNGQTFEKYAPGPVLDRSPFDPCFTASCCVLVEAGIWRMWYLSCIRWVFEQGIPQHHYHIKYAESSDGINWKRDGQVCIDFASPTEYAISRPCVLKEGDRYRMWYSHRGTTYRIGYAESSDGIQWRRMDHEAGIDVSETGWDSEMIEYPFVFAHQNTQYLLYNGNGYGKTGMGYAISEK